MDDETFHILVNICILLKIDARTVMSSKTRDASFIKNVLQYILFTLYNKNRLYLSLQLKYGGINIRNSFMRINNYIYTKDKKYYPMLLTINKLYPILDIGVAIYELKSLTYGFTQRNKWSKRQKKRVTPLRAARICNEIIKLERQSEKQVKEAINSDYFITSYREYRDYYNLPYKYYKGQISKQTYSIFTRHITR